MLRRLPLVPVVLTLGLLAARVMGTAPLSDPLGAPLPSGIHLVFPTVHLVFAPLFDLWDSVSLLPMSRLKGFVAGLALLYLVLRVTYGARRRREDPDAGPPIGMIRELTTLILVVIVFLAFVAAGMLWHRPMVALGGTAPGVVIADYHSHTSASHDVRGTLMRGFDAEANRRWHARAGFDVSFVTDHNTVDGFPAEWRNQGSTLLCPGSEVSAWRAHIVLLGGREAVDRAPYVDSLGGVLQLLREGRPRYGALTIASLPEYDRNHWGNLEAFVAAGVNGFEIVNASPRANELTQARRDSVAALARAHDLLLVAATDSHGWGAAVLGWNLVKAPGWRGEEPQACAELLTALRTGGTRVNQIAERHHLRSESAWPWILTPVGVVWETWRGLSPLQVLSWGAWIWIVGLGAAYRRP